MIGKRLRDARRAIQITQAELAARAGIDELSVSKISHYETERNSPNFRTACTFATILDVPECYFYCRDDRLAAHLLATHKHNKRYHLAPEEIAELAKLEDKVRSVLTSIDEMLNKRLNMDADDALHGSLKP